MTLRGRMWLFAVPALAIGALMVWAFTGLPAFGHYGGPYGNIINAGNISVTGTSCRSSETACMSSATSSSSSARA